MHIIPNSYISTFTLYRQIWIENSKFFHFTGTLHWKLRLLQKTRRQKSRMKGEIVGTALYLACSLLNANQLNIEDKSWVRRDSTRMTSGSVSIIRWASQFSSLTNTHLCDSLIPSLDNFTLSNLELEWITTIARRVEFLSIGECSCVMNHDSLSSFGECWPISFLDSFDIDTHYCWRFTHPPGTTS